MQEKKQITRLYKMGMCKLYTKSARRVMGTTTQRTTIHILGKIAKSNKSVYCAKEYRLFFSEKRLLLLIPPIL